jgi:hypothetical protein
VLLDSAVNVFPHLSVSDECGGHFRLGDYNASVFSLHAIPLSSIDVLEFLCLCALDIPVHTHSIIARSFRWP